MRNTNLLSLAVATAFVLLSSCNELAPRATPSESAAESEVELPDLARGAELFSTHCAVCHGTLGNGDGLAAPYTFPPPRDFGSGRFRLASTVNGVPSDDDLVATLVRGMPGSAMPAWGWLPQTDVRQLARYVRHLAVQGMARGIDERAASEGRATSLAAALVLAEQRLTPGARVALPAHVAVDAALLERGGGLYADNCASCHGPDGRGRGLDPQWNEDGNLNWARDFTHGILKGGASVDDLATRILVGLPGSSMGAFPGLSSSDVFALSSFVRTLVPEGAETRLVHTRQLVTAVRVRGALPTSPDDAGWSSASESPVTLAPLTWSDGAVFQAHLSAVHDGRSVAIRIRWQDPTRDDAATNDEPLVDAVALALSDEEAPPLFGMGSHEHAINLWHWRAARFIDAPGMLDLLAKGAHVQHDALRGEGQSDVGTVYLPAPSGPESGGRSTNDVAETFQSIEALAQEGRAVASHASWERGTWTVVFVRQLGPRSEREVVLTPGDELNLACAVWNGSNGDQRATKSISIWQRLQIEH